ncbi:MAG TPA: hypothetical protein QGF02_00690 [Candidatus Babeliales bacterium]|nr:hypothetical protein [Candidatus Babeliales bacterium]
MKKIIKILYICIVLNITPIHSYNLVNPTEDDIANIFMGAVEAHNSTKTSIFIKELTGNHKSKPATIKKTFLDALNKADESLKKKVAELTAENKKLAESLKKLPDPKSLNLQDLIKTVEDLQKLIK